MVLRLSIATMLLGFTFFVCILSLLIWYARATVTIYAIACNPAHMYKQGWGKVENYGEAKVASLLHMLVCSYKLGDTCTCIIGYKNKQNFAIHLLYSVRMYSIILPCAHVQGIK